VSYKVFDIGSYRAPGLRNVALTTPCFHDSNVALIESGETSRSN
jgi:cytochrome c peroxidase